MSVELPLFPLNTVLFPHMPLGLHIFEDRYRCMMRDCTESGTTFGVLAIREGIDVGPGAVPYSVGTLAQLRDVEQLPDGRYNLLVVGASRFRVDSFSHDRPYLTGRVHYLQDGGGAGTEAVARRLRSAFQSYATAVARSGGAEVPQETSLPDDPELLGYLVAAALNVETSRRQELLEMDSTADRLRGCLELVRRESLLLEGLSTRRATPQRVPRVSLN